ncbi:acetyltransferase (GNAT) family protein [Amycolatopsis sulphurea]|uniref:Acetyltransferase (GNAT) family protein n=1 Tax=Amycolatopsis sulphurea TaxID=76022 RepID=A0A2A9FGJ3_9PSEU|nr:GNAT family N-acetyltransferase [Amycolatopsis sulphurea]PFG50278.1 acetyltransferase (GNAT) family protein [Amycolatopsis sulphurea]
MLGDAPSGEIRVATRADEDHVVDALTFGFAEDPILAGTMFPDDELYPTFARRYFGVWTDLALDLGTIWTTGDTVGALLTFPSESLPALDNESDLHARLIEACGPYAERVLSVHNVLDLQHPEQPPHHYALFMGVAPGRRSRGLGTRLAHELFALADSEGRAVYGEASCERNSRLYIRMGLRPTGERITVFAHDILPLWRPSTRR